MTMDIDERYELIADKIEKANRKGIKILWLCDQPKYCSDSQLRLKERFAYNEITEEELQEGLRIVQTTKEFYINYFEYVASVFGVKCDKVVRDINGIEEVTYKNFDIDEDKYRIDDESYLNNIQKCLDYLLSLDDKYSDAYFRINNAFFGLLVELLVYKRIDEKELDNLKDKLKDNLYKGGETIK